MITVIKKRKWVVLNGTQISDCFKVCLLSWLFQVFEAVIAWVNHDKDVRQEHLAQLMEHVRLPLLSREYLVQVSVGVGVGVCVCGCCLICFYYNFGGVVVKTLL